MNVPASRRNPAPCPNFQGHDQPGGFGFLETTSDPCVVRSFGNGDWYHTDPGGSVACDLSRLVGTVVTIPIFSCTLDDVPAGGGAPPPRMVLTPITTPRATAGSSFLATTS